MGKNNNKSSTLKHSVLVAIGTFFLAIIFSLSSEFLTRFNSIIISLAFLFLIILGGIFFDIVGIASTSADESPFHAKCANRIEGAAQSLQLIRNADKVASFCNDVVGDICGTVSGALGASIIVQLLYNYPRLNSQESALTIGITATAAAITVGGKAYGKSYAIEQSNRIIFGVGRFLAKLEGLTGLQVFGGKRSGRGKGRVKKS